MFTPENDVLSNSDMLLVRAAPQVVDPDPVEPMVAPPAATEVPEPPLPPVVLLVPEQGMTGRRLVEGRTETVHVTVHNPAPSARDVDLRLRDVLLGVVWRGSVTLGPGETRHVQVPWTPEAGGRVLSVAADGRSVDLPHVYVEEAPSTESPGISLDLSGTTGLLVFALVGLVVTVMASLATSRYVVRRRARGR